MVKKIIIFFTAFMLGLTAGQLFMMIYKVNDAQAVGGPGLVIINPPGKPENPRIESRDE